jgi:2-succinyl-5-enolpyruvyl-6-hydroxy-3-cyclohexene-1-carboxylate synthase
VADGDQWSAGLGSWVDASLPVGSKATGREPSPASRALAQRWRELEAATQLALARELDGDDAPAPSEPWLARTLSRLLPPGLPLMLASSSPVRDWESFAAPDAPWRPIHGFRGASGIDGTLSIACGLAEACGQLVLVSGDLALLHDANGWLWARQLQGRLTVVLIENGGGGIFEQLPIRTQPPGRLDFERLFAMPQAVDQLALAGLHGVPGRRPRQAADLPGDLAWALQQPFAVLELRTRRRDDAALRLRLRRAGGAEAAASAGRMADPDSERR